ncbi:DUF397 domain-containing protein [Streptomyces sp. NPDC013187]|uniref:DUF397 domain-containing protein n=1 Tax=Streptomyces sp. NPDC013187 TaxID=3364865 RepID=UPI0036D1D560
MHQIYNGVPAGTLQDATWVKSRRSAMEGNCVEMATLPDGAVAVRNSRDPEGPALIYTRAEIVAFLAGARDGDFDALVE